MFSQKLKELRTFENLSQIDFATEIDFSQASISAWENGTREPGLEALVRIAKFFNVTVDYLLSNKSPSSYANSHFELTNLPEEKNLIIAYRKLPIELKRRADSYMKTLLTLAEEEEQAKKERKKV